ARVTLDTLVAPAVYPPSTTRSSCAPPVPGHRHGRRRHAGLVAEVPADRAHLARLAGTEHGGDRSPGVLDGNPDHVAQPDTRAGRLVVAVVPPHVRALAGERDRVAGVDRLGDHRGAVDGRQALDDRGDRAEPALVGDEQVVAALAAGVGRVHAVAPES